jgi:hypothetical protein
MDGRSVQARVLTLSAAERSVEMERFDGLKFSLKWNQLCAADQALLAEEATQEVETETNQTDSEGTIELPSKYILDDVPMIRQKGNYCVPASAAMIAGYHGIKTDQDQVAELSSEMSASNQGTYPSDMLLAMQKLGFDGHYLKWNKQSTFEQQTLPAIRQALYEKGPIYISFRPNVFGSMGHGCVMIGYDDRKEELYFYNPWGNEFEKSYEQVASEGYGIAIIEAPKLAPSATEAFITQIQQAVPKFTGNILDLYQRLQQANIPNELVWCSRRDARSDKHFAQDTARDDGRTILELAFERNPAVFIPRSPDGDTDAYLFVTRPPNGGARFLVRCIDSTGWHEAELMTLGRLTRNWTTAFKSKDSDEKMWELPMIELHPLTSL